MTRRSAPLLLLLGAAAVLITGCIKRPYSLEATGIKSYDAAVQKSLRTGHPMVVFVSASWCGSCQIMQSELLQPGVKMALMKTVPYTIDFDSPRTKELRRRFYGGRGVPEIILIASDGRELKRQRGWANGDQFVHWLQSSLTAN